MMLIEAPSAIVRVGFLGGEMAMKNPRVRSEILYHVDRPLDYFIISQSL